MSGKRDDFLIAMYQASWANVTRADDALWKSMAAYTAVFAGLAVATAAVGNFGFLLLVVLFGMFGIVLSFNANLWFARNIGMIANIEAELLDSKDWNVIIPKKWQSKVSFWTWDEVWFLMIYFFAAVSLAATAIMFPGLKHVQQDYILDVLLMGFLFIGLYAAHLSVRHEQFMTEAPGIASANTPTPNPVETTKPVATSHA